MKTSSLRRVSLWSVCLILAFGAAQAGAATVTGIMAFSCDEGGNPAGNFVWDTRGLDSDFYKIFLSHGVPEGNPDGLTAAFINGPGWGQAPINLTLEEGTHEFTMFFQDNGPWPAFALHLFFDSNTVASISVKAPLRTGNIVPPFSPNSASRTFSMTSYPSPNAPAAGTASTVLDRRVELTDYYVAASVLYGRDRVSTHNVGSNARLDYVGTFTLAVGPQRPELPRREIKVQIHVTEITICWESETNRSYQVQYRSPSMTSAWTDLGPPVTGNGGTNCVSDRVPFGGGQRFYRVLGLP